MRGLEEVEKRIVAACERAGRPRESVQLVAVSKGQPIEKLQEAYRAGQRVFGESRAQELAVKYGAVGPDVEWHFIGPLQRNKIRQVRPAVAMLHSLDRIELAAAWMKGPGQAPPALLQVKLGGEATKHGFQVEAVRGAVEACEELGLPLVGLMAIPPPSSDQNEARAWFERLRDVRDSLNHKAVRELSMGMSQDFEVAIEAGATIIRVGSAIFGDRTS
ncbi:MAG: YggS family pyridoxal phosphate-dependent enzyme [Acidimicrobiia bacterium]|nr:YggS family pyridoxal phosphate-dependent enzyme [Acidimicrobiia bacterium]